MAYSHRPEASRVLQVEEIRVPPASWKRAFVSIVAMTLGCSLHAFGQASVSGTLSRLQTAREFLRELYPKLNSKRYVTTVEAAVPFDDPSREPNEFTLDVGDGPKFLVLECCIGGFAGGQLPAQPASPAELDTNPASGNRPSETKKSSTLPRKYWDAEGRVYPKQHLSSGFTFDDQGRLTGFIAHGSSVGSPEDLQKFFDLVRPEMTDAEIIATLKSAGAKYGPNDKARFVEHLPLKQLEPFLGHLDVISVSFRELHEDRNNLPAWPNWDVDVTATTRAGTKATYRLTFDSFAGDLDTLRIINVPTDKAVQK